MINVRRSILIITTLLIAIGVVIIYSASSIYAFEQYGDELYFLKRHLLYLLYGLILTTLVMSVDYHKFQKFSKPLFLFSVFLLILVLLPGIGREIAGAKRWLRLGIISLQPSVIAKIALVLYIADVLARKQDKIKSFLHGFLPPMIVLAVYIVLVLRQPDLGTAVTFTMVALIICFVGGVKVTHLLSTIFMIIPFAYFLVFTVPYRRSRIIAFLNPWQDPKGAGYQIIQSLVAMGSGEFFGLGLGKSKQKLFYLPAAHTDFIFSILGEELGFIGTSLVIILFGVLIWQATKIALKAKELFGQLLAVGIISCIGLEAIINIGVSISFLPTKGLPLPFISYGGSALIFNMVAIGLLLNIGKD
ncbi:MAG: putative lipid II flippase FtsW [Candidatus Omnitrophota bacterium]